MEAEILEEQVQNKKIGTIGVLTSGGDAPGMNGVIRAVTRSAIYHGMNVMGVHRGFHGLWKGDIHPLNARDVSDILQRGGTQLMTARSKSFMTDEGQQKGAEMCQVFGLDAVVVCGGDGSYKGALALSQKGIPVIAIPGTIDNDIASTDYTIGYDTALNTALDAIDKLRDTAASHERCSVVELMGRRSGYLALSAGIATGAEVILIPEHPLDFDRDVVKKILSARNRGKHHFIVITAEGIGNPLELAARLEESTGIETRASVLGYIQRGGNPSFRDRYVASLMGVQAVNCLVEGRYNRAICLRNGEICDIDLAEALTMSKSISELEFKNSGVLSL